MHSLSDITLRYGSSSSDNVCSCWYADKFTRYLIWLHYGLAIHFALWLEYFRSCAVDRLQIILAGIGPHGRKTLGWRPCV